MMLKIPKGCTINTSKCHYLTWNKGNGNGLEMKPCCLKHLRETIFYLADLFNEFQIIYWIDFGTLLGAIRSGRTIPHDTDGDMCLFLESRPKVLKLQNRIAKDGFYMSNKPTSDGHIKIYRSKKNHMAVDLFFWKLDLDKGILKSGGLNEPKSFPNWWVEKLVSVKIFDKEVMAPREPEKFLRMRFGKDWKVPQNKKVHYYLATQSHIYGFQYARRHGWNSKRIIKKGLL